MEPLTGCTRCGGLTIPEPFRDIDLFSLGWHCLLCGEIVDGVILRNRAMPSITSSMDEQPVDWEQQSDADEYEIETKTEHLSNLTRRTGLGC